MFALTKYASSLLFLFFYFALGILAHWCMGALRPPQCAIVSSKAVKVNTVDYAQIYRLINKTN